MPILPTAPGGLPPMAPPRADKTSTDAADELRLMPLAGNCAIALSVYCAIKGWTLGPALADPPDAMKNDPGVLAYQDAKSAIFREAREYETWEAGSLGNATYWAKPPDLGHGPGVAPPPSGGGGSGGVTVASVANVLLAAVQTVLSNPTSAAALLAMLQKAMSGGTVTPPASGSSPAVAP